MDLRECSGDASWAAKVVDDWRTAPLAPADRALCAFAEKLGVEPWHAGDGDVQVLRSAGLSDEAIHDAVQVIAYFSYINRVADALGTDLEDGMPPKPRSWWPQRPAPERTSPDAPDGDDAPLTLEPVTKALLSEVLRLQVAPFQQRFVASTAVSLAQAHFDATLVPRVIRVGEPCVGFVMTKRVHEREMLYVARWLIDERWQGRGLGARALRALIDETKATPGIRSITLTHVPAPGSPEGFYRRFGFAPTGRADEDGELEMELRW